MKIVNACIALVLSILAVTVSTNNGIAAQLRSHDVAYANTQKLMQTIDQAIGGVQNPSAVLVTGTDRGGSLMAYVSKVTDLKYVANIGFSHSDVIYEYYFDRKELIAVVVTRNTYGVSKKKNDFSHPVSTTKTTFYFVNGHLNGADGNTKMIPKDSAGMESMEKYLITGVEDMRTGMGKHVDTIDISTWVKDIKIDL